MYKKLKKYIRHTHIKDGLLTEGKVLYKLLGQGEAPIFEAIEILKKGNFKGLLQF